MNLLAAFEAHIIYSASQSGNFDWTTSLFAPSVAVLTGLLGYYLRGMIDRRNAPQIEADKKRVLQRNEFVDSAGSTFFDLNHWLRNRIPGSPNLEERGEFITRSFKTVYQLREDARHARGFGTKEKEDIWRIVERETDAILKCLEEYTKNREPDLNRLERAGAERQRLFGRIV